VLAAPRTEVSGAGSSSDTEHSVEVAVAEVPRSDLPCDYPVRQGGKLDGPILRGRGPGDSLAGLSRDRLLIGRSNIRNTTKPLVSDLLSLDGSRRELCHPLPAIFSKNSYYQRPQQDSNLRTRLRRPLLYPLSYGGWRTRSPSQYPVGTEQGYQSQRSGGHVPDLRARGRLCR
jgi:hypothetical protein